MAKKNRRRARVAQTKAESQRLWRLRLNQSGRAVQSAIVAGRRLLKENNWSARVSLTRVFMKFPEHGEQVRVWDIPRLVATGQEVFVSRRVFTTSYTNEDAKLTACWLIIERTRAEREADRRLCRFYACPYEWMEGWTDDP